MDVYINAHVQENGENVKKTMKKTKFNHIGSCSHLRTYPDAPDYFP